MLRKGFLMLLFIFLFVVPVNAADPDPIVDEGVVTVESPTDPIAPPELKPTITGIVYTQEAGSIMLSDGTTKQFNAVEMGYKEYEWYFTNAKVGKTEPTTPIKKDKYIVIITKLPQLNQPPLIVKQKINGVILEDEIDSVVTEVNLIEEESPEEPLIEE